MAARKSSSSPERFDREAELKKLTDVKPFRVELFDSFDTDKPTAHIDVFRFGVDAAGGLFIQVSRYDDRKVFLSPTSYKLVRSTPLDADGTMGEHSKVMAARKNARLDKARQVVDEKERAWHAEQQKVADQAEELRRVQGSADEPDEAVI